MPPKKNRSVVATSSGAPATLSEGVQQLEVYMNIVSTSNGSALPPTEIGRLVFRLARETHPRTCENFKLLSLGTVIPFDKKAGRDQRVFSYANTPFTRVTEDGIQGGNIHRLLETTRFSVSAGGNGSSTLGANRTQSPPSGQVRSPSPAAGGGGKNAIPESQLQSIFGPVFQDENKGYLAHSYGTLAMCNSGPDSNGCQFFICTVKPHPLNLEITQATLEHLNRNYVAFGQLIEGEDVLEVLAAGMAGLATNQSGDLKNAPTTYSIGSCGVVGIEAPPLPPSGKK